MINNIKGIICDLDGTLYNNSALQNKFHECFIKFISLEKNICYSIAEERFFKFQKYYKKNELIKSEMNMLNEMNLNVIDWLRYTNDNIDPSDYLSHDYELMEIFEKNNRIWIDVATNSSFKMTERILNAIGIKKYITNIWSPDIPLFVEQKLFKPSLLFYKNIMQFHEINGCETAVIGDRYNVDLSYADELSIKYKFLINSIDDTRKVLRKIII